MKVDSMHSLIERRSNHKEIYIPAQWETLAASVKLSKQYKLVHSEGKMSNVYDSGQFAIYWIQNRDKTDEKGKVNWMKIHLIHYEKTHSDFSFIKSRV